MSAVIRFAVAVLLALTALPWVARWAWQVGQRVGPPVDGWWTWAGIALGSALVWWKRPSWLLHTLLHEANHALVAWMLLVKVRNFQASDGQGGKVIHDRTDPVRTTLIALAPYTVPLLLVPVLLGHRFVVDLTWRHVLGALGGMLYPLHLHALYHNVRLNLTGRQADLVRMGRPLSIVVIAAGLLAVSAWWLWELFV